VVIAAFNAERTIGSAVGSALDQTERDVEVIVVDDGSTDGTADVVRTIEDPRLRLVAQTNRGQAAARNHGVAVCSGEYVGFLDSDDLWLPDFLSQAAQRLDAWPRAGFAYTDAYAFDPVTGRVRKESVMSVNRPPIPPPAEPEAFLLELLDRNFLFVSTVVRRAVLTAVGGYSEHLRRVEDYDLALRILMSGFGAAWVPGQHALYRVHDGQMSSDLAVMYAGTLAMFEGLPTDALPSQAHRKRYAARVQALSKQVRAERGDDRLRHLARRLRHRVGQLRRRLGLADTWYRRPPEEVAAAFHDLTRV
jgi:glycosyltransferase involved in cell wall biosynthesis